MTNAGRRRATNILDVAHEAGVSRTTVSRVMNEPERVSPEVRERVLKAAADLKYAPSRLARGLRNGRTGVLALLVGDISQPFHAALSQGAASAAEARGMSVVLGDLRHSEERFVEMLARVAKQGVDGIVVATADDLDAPAMLVAMDSVRAAGIPLVISGQAFEPTHAPILPIDQRARCVKAVEHLLHLGRTRIALGVTRQESGAAHAMTEGFGEIAGLDRSAGVFEIGWTFEMARSATIEFLRESVVDALVVPTVPLALGALRALQSLDLEPGVDVAVVACEAVELAQQTTPTITTVGEDPREIGAALVDALATLMGGRRPFIPTLEQRVEVRQTSGVRRS